MQYNTKLAPAFSTENKCRSRPTWREKKYFEKGRQQMEEQKRQVMVAWRIETICRYGSYGNLMTTTVSYAPRFYKRAK